MFDVTWIDKFIREGKSAQVSLHNIYDSMLMMERDNETNMCRIPLYDLFLKHWHQFADTVQDYTLSERHMYQPKTISAEIYGTTEMWLPLLRLNRMRNVTEFTRREIQIYNPTFVKPLIEIFLKRAGKIM